MTDAKHEQKHSHPVDDCGACALEQLRNSFETPEEQQARMRTERKAIQHRQWAEAGQGTKLLSIISLVLGTLWLALLFWFVGFAVVFVITTRLGLPLSSTTPWLALWVLVSIAIAAVVPVMQYHGTRH